MKYLINIDHRIIYILVIISITLPLIAPLNLPVDASEEVTKIYQKIDSLMPGDTVLLLISYAAQNEVEMKSQSDSVISHLFSKEGIKIVSAALVESGNIYLNQYMSSYASEYQKEAGRDFVNLGFVYGGEVAVANLANDIHQAAPADSDGNLLADLEMMKNINDGSDFDLVINFGATQLWSIVRYITDVYNVDLVSGIEAVFAIRFLPYYVSGQLDGYLNGLVGAAGYESLIGIRGPASKHMDPLSSSSMLIIVLIIVGNISYLVEKRQKTSDRSAR